MIEKLKETALSVLPISAIVFLSGATIVGFPGKALWWFALATILVIVGLTVFLTGVDLGISHIGERCGAALTARRSLSLMIVVAFAIGIVVTVAEPDIQVFGDQVAKMFAGISKVNVVLAIALGVGIFMALGVLRTIFALPLKWTLFVLYGATLGLAALAPRPFIGVAFDSGGATTGPLTVPFIMALGLGVSAVRGGRDDGFGFTGIASIGPLMAMLSYSAFGIGAQAGGGGADASGVAEASGLSLTLVFDVLRDVAVSVLPLYAMAWLMQIFLIKMSTRQMARVSMGFLLSATGLAIFLAGVHCGFMEAGRMLGAALGAKVAEGGAGWLAVTVAIGLVVGGVTVCAEPAVWVLGDQVEETSGGVIRRKVLLSFLSVATALAVGLAILRAAMGFHLAWLLLPGYLAALAMMPFTPGVYTGIAFDSGGVASGPLTTTFVLSFTLGAASGSGGVDAFGVVALVAMMPLVAIQAMGIAIELKKRKAMRRRSVAAAKEKGMGQ